MIEQVVRWGATQIILLGIKGEISNHFTLLEWPALLQDLQRGFRHGKIEGKWGMIEERRISLEQLKKVLAEAAKDNTYVIVCSCPNQHFEVAANICRKAKSPRNVITAWGREDDMSSLEKVYGSLKLADINIEPELYQSLPPVPTQEEPKLGKSTSSGKLEASNGHPFASEPWWAGEKSRPEVNDILGEATRGTYLVRLSNRAGKQHYTLSFRHDRIHHVIVNEKPDASGKMRYSVCEEHDFADVPEMIDFFTHDELAFMEDGIELKFRLHTPYKDQNYDTFEFA